MSGTSTAPALRRALRRETHSPRSVAAVAVALLSILALAWLAAEIVLAAVGARPLLLSPSAMGRGIAAVPDLDPLVLGAAGIVLVVVGAGLILAGVLPGRRHRHVIPGSAPAVVDDAVIASGLADVASRTAGLPADAAEASVGSRQAFVRLVPRSGLPVDREAVGSALGAALDRLDATPPLRAEVRIDDHGEVGA